MAQKEHIEIRTGKINTNIRSLETVFQILLLHIILSIFRFQKTITHTVAILSGKTNLVSPYQTFITHFQAESIVIKFIFDLTNGEDFEIIEIKNLDFIPYYFGGLAGDSATLIAWKNKTLLILTDGTD